MCVNRWPSQIKHNQNDWLFLWFNKYKVFSQQLMVIIHENAVVFYFDGMVVLRWLLSTVNTRVVISEIWSISWRSNVNVIRKRVKWTCFRFDVIELFCPWILINLKSLSIDFIDITFQFNFVHVTTWARHTNERRKIKPETNTPFKTRPKNVNISSADTEHHHVTYWSILFSLHTQTTHTPNLNSN